MIDEDIEWYHLAICRGMNDHPPAKPGEPRKKYVDKFYEGYEEDPVFAKTIDSICFACPVRSRCLREGIENKDSGVWGGVFLIGGKMNPARNAHKTEDIWQQVREGLLD